MNATANPALGYPYFPYYPVVLDILRSRLADSVLDAPCDRGWLGDMARPATGRLVEVDGIGPAMLPAPANGYRRLTVHDLETPLPATAAYDLSLIHISSRVQGLVEVVGRALPADAAPHAAMAITSNLVGAIQLARALGDNAQGRAMLAAARESILAQYDSEGRPASH